eukprot:6154764-Prymnesium_polylepis.1
MARIIERTLKGWRKRAEGKKGNGASREKRLLSARVAQWRQSPADKIGALLRADPKALHDPQMRGYIADRTARGRPARRRKKEGGARRNRDGKRARSTD